MMENMQEKLERAYERINELQNKNLELRERNSSLLKEQIQAQAIIEKQKNVVKEWIVVQDDISMTAIKRNSILAVYQNRNMDEAFVCTTNGKEFLIRLPIKTVLKLIIGEDSIDEAAAGQQENTAGELSDCEAFRELIEKKLSQQVEDIKKAISSPTMSPELASIGMDIGDKACRDIARAAIKKARSEV